MKRYRTRSRSISRNPLFRDTPRNTLLRIPMPENNNIDYCREIKKIRVHTDRPSPDSNTGLDKILLAP